MKKNLDKYIADGNLALIQDLIAQGENINQRDEHGTPSILKAFSQNQTDQSVIEFLVKLGADVNIKCNKGNTPLKLAVTYNFVEIAELLLTKGANPNIKDIEGNTVLSQALQNANEDMVRLLARHGANLNALDKNGNVPLFNLLNDYRDHFSMVMLLIELKANVNFKNNLGIPILNVAVKNEYLEITKSMLQANANPNSKNKSGEPSLTIALTNRNEDMVTLLADNGADLNHLDKDGNSLLMSELSGYSVHHDMTALLIRLGADVNLANNVGSVPLFKSIEKELITTTRHLLANQANPHSKSIEGKSPLHCAVKKNNYQLIKLLLNEGADPEGIESTNCEITKLLKDAIDDNSIPLSGDIDQIPGSG